MNNNNLHSAPIELLTKYFANEATVSEKNEIKDWRTLSPENEKEFEAFKKLWQYSGEASVKEAINIDAEWNSIEQIIEPQKKTIHLFKKALKIAASIILISTLAFIGFNQLNKTSRKATVAESTQITLPDGTIVSLNAGSKITYSKNFGKENRQLALKGEAFFVVTKNQELPFVINANTASIEVVGTEFNVKAYKDMTEVRVLVTEGKVQLYETKQPANKTILVAGETGTYNKKVKSLSKALVENKNDIAWKTLVLEFNNTPLAEVAEILTNTYHKDIRVDSKVKDCPITVKFSEEDLASVLKVLKSTLSLKITKSENQETLIISGEGCE